MEKFKHFLKEVWEWIVVIFLFCSGYYLYQYFFKKSGQEKKLLEEISDNKEKMDKIDKEINNKVEQEKKLDDKQKEVSEQIKKKEEEIEKKKEEFKKEQDKIIKDSLNTETNIDYINNKYGK